MEISLQPQIDLKPFEKWGIDFMGTVDPPSKGHHYILVCIDYVAKWAEVKALPTTREDKVANFLYKNILQRLSASREIAFDQGPQFMSTMIESFIHKYKMTNKNSTPYHPQANGQVEATNKELENILTKTVSLRKKRLVRKIR